MKRAIFSITFTLLFFHLCIFSYADDFVEESINNMPIEQKIGQLLLIGFKGKALTSRAIEHIKKIQPGGIVFYGSNFNNASDIPPMIKKIQAEYKNNSLPIFVAIDQEGGIVHRIEGEDFSPPSAPSIGAMNSELLAKDIGTATGNALKSLGINIILAPVLDVPPDLIFSPMKMRSFSDSPTTVGRLGTAYIQGLKNSGILSTAKHFPGLGKAQEDSHRFLPHVIWKNKSEMDDDIMPFKNAVKAGVDIIMAGHFIAEPGDSHKPSSLSSFWMKDILRKEMGFQGLIIVDNIEMKPISKIMPINKAAIESFKAGADIIMVSHERENQENVFLSLIDAIKKGEISKNRLNESLRRIINAKLKLQSNQSTQNKIINKTLKELSESIIDSSIISLKLKGVQNEKISKNATVLYAGFNQELFRAINNSFKHTENLNTYLEGLKNRIPNIDIDNFMNKFDAIIIDADYMDVFSVISICNKLNKLYVLFSTRSQNLQDIILKFQPKRIVISFDSSKKQIQAALETISGIRNVKGRLPFKIKSIEQYTYTYY